MTSKKSPTVAFLLKANPVQPAPGHTAPEASIATLLCKKPAQPEEIYFPLSTPALLQTLREMYLGAYAPKTSTGIAVGSIFTQDLGSKYTPTTLSLVWQESPAIKDSVTRFITEMASCAAEGLDLELTESGGEISFSHPYFLLETLHKMAARYTHIIDKNETRTPFPDTDDDAECNRILLEEKAAHIILRDHATKVFSAENPTLKTMVIELMPSGPHTSLADGHAAAYQVMKLGLTRNAYIIDLDRLVTLASIDCNVPQPYAHAAYH